MTISEKESVKFQCFPGNDLDRTKFQSFSGPGIMVGGVPGLFWTNSKLRTNPVQVYDLPY